MKQVLALVGFAVLTGFGVTSCRFVDPSYPAFKSRYVGQSVANVLSAIQAGQVRGVVVAIDRDTRKPVDLSLDLEDGEKWALSGNGDVARALAAIDAYNAAASNPIQVRQVDSVAAATPVAPGPTPTGHPRPSN